MSDRRHPGEERHHDLGALGRIYLDALAWYDWRAIDPHRMALRANLGAILAVLGWKPDDDVVLIPSQRSSRA